jgi:hypothetical protein
LDSEQSPVTSGTPAATEIGGADHLHHDPDESVRLYRDCRSPYVGMGIAFAADDFTGTFFNRDAWADSMALS